MLMGNYPKTFSHYYSNHSLMIRLQEPLTIFNLNNQEQVLGVLQVIQLL